MNDLRGAALACSADAALRAALTEAGFVVTAAPACPDALPAIRHDSWAVVAVDTTTGRDTRAYLNGLPGVRRRQVFVLCVDPAAETGDRFRAWAESADLVVNPSDLPQLRKLVGDALREKTEFYRRFNEIRREAGARLGAHA